MLKKFLLTIGFLFISTPCFAEDLKNYVIKIDGKEISINIGETKIIKDNNGKEINVSLEKNKASSFRDGIIYFEHDSNYSVSVTKLKGLKQLMLTNGVGSIIMIQEYDESPKIMMNTMLLDSALQMLNIKSTQSVRKKINTKISDGHTLEGVEQSLDLAMAKIEAKTGEIDIDQKKYALVSINMVGENLSGKDMVDLFWKSLRLSK